MVVPSSAVTFTLMVLSPSGDVHLVASGAVVGVGYRVVAAVEILDAGVFVVGGRPHRYRERRSWPPWRCRRWCWDANSGVS